MAVTVSVIVPCFNGSRWIRETLASVLAQNYESIQLIVVDDGSGDDSARIVEEEFADAMLIRTANRGASHARNTGTAAASGAFIQYLDADDLLAPGKLTAQLRLLEETGADAAYGDWQRLIRRVDTFEPGDVVHRKMNLEPELELFGDFWCPPAAYLFRRGIVDRVGGWNEGLPVIQDARFALDCALRGATFAYHSEVVAYYRQHGPDSLSRRDPVAFNRDVYRNACEVEAWWRENGGITAKRSAALVECYGYVARATYERDRLTFEKAYGDLQGLAPGYVPQGPPHLALASRWVGYRRAEAAALVYRRVKEVLTPGRA